MKKLLPLGLAALFTVPAFAQDSSGQRHMFTFDADSILQGVWSFDRSKRPGSSPDNDTELNLQLNYFYTLPALSKLQVGGSISYLKDTNWNGDVENYGAQVGGIWNFQDDFSQAWYVKGLVGLMFNHQYGSDDAGNDETYNFTAAVGKRFSLSQWGVNHVVYTPEVAYTGASSTTSADFDYSTALELRFLQFSVFF